jgi:hypothetical protein
MLLVKLVTGDYFIFNENFKLYNFSRGDSPVVIEGDNCYELTFHNDLTKNLKNLTTKMDYTFNKMSKSPFYLKEIVFNRETIVYAGEIELSSQIAKEFQRQTLGLDIK